MKLSDAISKVSTTAKSQEISIEDSGWLGDKSSAEIRKLNAAFRKRYDTLLLETIQLLGEPSVKYGAKDKPPSWYPETLSLAGWDKSDRTVFLALVHHDQETPIAILFGSLTAKEIAELEE
ncbi:MAG: hypothetical protein WC538_23615 [Thermoanaerobaculia bacterium]